MKVQKRVLLLILLLCLVCLGSCRPYVRDGSLINGAGVNGSGDAGRGEVLLPDPDLVQGRLDNGFEYFLFNNSTPENRVSMHLVVQAGSMHEKESEKGVAHYLEHMLFNGSTHFKPGELVEYFQSIGMRFGADANAHTGFFQTVYDILLPSGERSGIEDALTVIDDYAKGALLLEEEVERERGIILSEMRERDSVSYRTFKASLKFEISGSRLANRLPIGDKTVIENADRKLLKGFYDRWYRPDNMALVMVGDFDVVEVEGLIKEKFSTMTPRSPSSTVLPENSWESHSGVKSYYHHEPESGSTDITIETVVSTPFKADTPEDLKKRVAVALAGVMLQNRLDRLVRAKGAPFSDAGVHAGTYLRTLKFSSMSAKADPEKWDSALAALEKNLRQALEFGFSNNELERVKADFLTGLASGVKEAATRKSSILARQIIRSCSDRRVFQSPKQTLDFLEPFVKNLTLTDANAAFREAWSPDHRLVLVTGNADITSGREASAESLISQAYEKSQNAPVELYEQMAAGRFPYLPEPDGMGKIEKREDIPDLGIVQIDFKNGVRLNLKKSDFKKGEFIFKMDFGHGRQAEPESMPGLALVATRTINGSGLGRFDKDQMDAALSGRNVTVRFHTDEDGFSLSGSADPEEVLLVFQLLQSYLLDPGVRPNVLALVKERYRQMVSQMNRTPEGMMELFGTRFLANGDLRFGLPGKEAVDAVTVDQITAWLAPYFDHAALEVSVVGDMDIEAVISAATTYLGTLEKRQWIPLTASRKPPGFPTGETFSLSVDTKIEKASVRLAFPTDDFWDIKQTRRLNILASILSERLRKIIREKFGAAYSPYAYNGPSRAFKGYGILHAVVGVEPDNADFVIQELNTIVDSLLDRTPDKKELDLVLEPVLTHIKDLKRNNRYWLDSVLSGSREHPEKLEWSRQFFEDYRSVSVQDIEGLIKKYILKESAALIKILPYHGDSTSQ